MGDVIRLLPDSVANQIAAGEVIQRPASVVKELVENAVDAGASEIHVLVIDSGRTSLQIIDNGKGMSPTDARLAFERHATSKIREASDLFSLHTMGFRGEALPSIAAVSEVELKTKTEGDELGTRILISGSKLQVQEPTSCPVGANFCVKNLFFNIPARRKFLKSNATELSNILTEFERVALVNPEISFYLTSNGAEMFNLPASSLRQRIISVFGNKMDSLLLPVNVETSLVTIKGFVAKPDSARKKGCHQYFFANGRYMRHPYFHKAVMEAFDRLIPEGYQVSYFLYFETEPASIDVNIHPTKVEIKFDNEQSVWQILLASLKEALGRFNAVPSIDFDMTDAPDTMPVFQGNRSVEPPKVQYNPQYNPFGSTQDYKRKDDIKGWEQFYQHINKEDIVGNVNKSPNEHIDIEPFFSVDKTAADFTISGLLQVKGRFILTSVKSGLMLIEQHRAHVRILYDLYMEQMSGKPRLSQGLLFPEMLQLPQSEAVILDSIQDQLAALGFDLTSLGGGSYAVNGVPEGIDGLNPAELVRNMVRSAVEKGGNPGEEIASTVALTLAKSASIVKGQVLSTDEMSDLVDRLFACQTPGFTPDGRRIIATIAETDIYRLFD